MKKKLNGALERLLETALLGTSLLFLIPYIPSTEEYPDWFPASLLSILPFLISRLIRYKGISGKWFLFVTEGIGFVAISFAMHQVALILLNTASS